MIMKIIKENNKYYLVIENGGFELKIGTVKPFGIKGSETYKDHKELIESLVVYDEVLQEGESE